MKTFVVRVFMPVEPKPAFADGSLHGLVEEIGTSRQARFRQGDELLAFLAGAETVAGEPRERSSS
jgi:hypothetical protein